MWYKNNLLYNSLELPAYWVGTQRIKRELLTNWRVEKLTFGKHAEQYALRVQSKDWAVDDKRPVAVYFHGGAWTFGSPESFLPAARLFIAAGYEVIMPSYRRLPRYNFKHIHADLQSMRDALLADRYIAVVAGMSAGGHLAAFTSWNNQFWEEAKLNIPDKLILCGAVVNFSEMNLAAGLRLLAGAPGSATYNFADPVQHFAKAEKLPKNQLFIHGTSDATVSFHQMHCFYASQKDKHPEIESLWIKGGTHLDSCRWMYQEDEAAKRIRALLEK